MAEFEYRPVARPKTYRVVVHRKRLVVEKGQLWLFEPDRYFFYITNDRTTPASEVVFLANDRCDQENLIAQLKSGVKALAYLSSYSSVSVTWRQAMAGSAPREAIVSEIP